MTRCTRESKILKPIGLNVEGCLFVQYFGETRRILALISLLFLSRIRAEFSYGRLQVPDKATIDINLDKSSTKRRLDALAKVI